jgi:prolyl oligopeptidase
MVHYRRAFIMQFLTGVAALSSAAAATPHPAVLTETVVEEHFGTRVVDPQRHLENLDAPEVKAWLRQQADAAASTFAALPGRAALLARLRDLEQSTPFTVTQPQRLADGDIFFLKQAADEDVARLWVRDGDIGADTLLVDPAALLRPAADQHVAIDGFVASPDGLHVLYTWAADGTEEASISVFDRGSGSHLPDLIGRVDTGYAPPSWLEDGRGFVYSQRRPLADGQPEADCYRFTQARLHVLGTDPAADPFVFGSEAAGSPPLQPLDFPAVIITPGSAWAVGQVRHGDEADLTLYAAPVASLGSADIVWKKICDRRDAVRSFTVSGDAIFLVTTGGPEHAVVRMDLAEPTFADAETVFAPTDMVVETVAAARDAIYIEAVDHAIRRVVRLPHEAAPAGRGVSLVATPPGEPSATIAAARADVPGVLLKTQSWIRVGGLRLFDPQKGRLVDAQLSPDGEAAPEWLTSTETIVESHDGARVPLSIIHRSDLARDGSHPALLEGYGAYGFTFPMTFTPQRLAWLERGGVIAVAHIRGGGTFGRAWHHAGRRTTKPNTWKDFIACAEHLVEAGYTSSRRLCGHGRSAGGILIGRAVTERPDLFAAAHIGVGCTDMIRFETTKNGPPNIPEFGTVTDEAGFRGLLAMSTLHQIRDGAAYPAVVLTHGINDPRVAPWQSAKTAARFQEATTSGKPVLLRIDYHAGHGMGSTRRQQQEELADVWSFFLWQCGDPDFQPQVEHQVQSADGDHE